MKITRKQLRQIIKEATDTKLSRARSKGNLPDARPDEKRAARRAERRHGDAEVRRWRELNDQMHRVEHELKFAQDPAWDSDADTNDPNDVDSQDMADAKRHAKPNTPEGMAKYLGISVEDWYRIRQELDDHYEDRHREDQMESKKIRIKRSDLTKMVHSVLSEDALGASVMSNINDAVSQQMTNIQKQREALAEKMKAAIAAQDTRSVENIQKQLAALDKASEELSDARTQTASNLSPESVSSDKDPEEYTTVEGKIRKADLLAIIIEAQQELDDLQPVYDFGNKGEDIESYDPMAVAAAETAIAVLGLQPGMSKHELPLGGELENEIYHALEAEGLTWQEDRLTELGDQALSVAGILLGVGSKHF
jgi:hypothetical protein